MTYHTFDYHDDGSRTVLIGGDPDVGMFFAESWLRERGFSIGPVEPGPRLGTTPAPRGIVFGELPVGPWSGLRNVEREALHGEVRTSLRGPVAVMIYAGAPAEVLAAVVAPPLPRAPMARPGRGLTSFDLALLTAIVLLVVPAVFAFAQSLAAPRHPIVRSAMRLSLPWL